MEQVQVLLEVLSLEPWIPPPEISFRKIFEFLNPACKEPAPEGAIGDEPDPKLAHGCEHTVLLDIPRPERVLGLKRRNWVDGISATDRLRGSLRHAEVTNLTGQH